MTRTAARIFKGDFSVIANTNLGILLRDKAGSRFRLEGGAEYFIVPNVSIGPVLNAGFYFGDEKSPDKFVLSIIGLFKLYF